MENRTLVLCGDEPCDSENERNRGNPNWLDFSFNIFIQVIDLGLTIPQQCHRLEVTWYYTPPWLLLNRVCNITDL